MLRVYGINREFTIFQLVKPGTNTNHGSVNEIIQKQEYERTHLFLKRICSKIEVFQSPAVVFSETCAEI
ncbi:hypothetical protein DLD82_01335 [Methanospirillum stamsii]|uniref:Uncharacterized protein n=1 Tax=Methanospirillum stamsii TaxID=1277351 RepID=A0A2V2N864_9EURY|nr:hypothetical protein DLD82_01335 [Methanospirillum stamsii]